MCTGDLKQARAVFDRAVEVSFKSIDDLASVWCAYAEMEIRNGQPKRALLLLHRATTPPPRPKNTTDAELSVQHKVFKALKIWSLYVDLEESIGTFQVRAIGHCWQPVTMHRSRPRRRTTASLTSRSPRRRWSSTMPPSSRRTTTLRRRSRFDQPAQTRTVLNVLQVYERGVALFNWPIVFEIWNVYLLKFIQRYVRLAYEVPPLLSSVAGQEQAGAHARAV